MAFLRNFLQRKSSFHLLTVLRGTTFLFRGEVYKSISTSSAIRCNVESIASSITAKKSMKNHFPKNNSVDSLTKQAKECMRGIVPQKEILDNYWKCKINGTLSEGDFVRILVRLARFRELKFKADDKNIGQFYEVLLDDIKLNKSQLKPFQLADVLWSLGKLDNADSELFALFGGLVETRNDLSEFSNADLTMILWGHGKTNIQSPIVFSLIQKELLRRGVETLTTRELCQIVWSFARVMKTSAKLYASVRKTIQQRDVTQFNNQDIIMLLWAFSEGGVNVKPLFRYIKGELLGNCRLGGYGAKDLSLILWSFANQGIQAQDLFAEVEKDILTRPKINFDHQSLVVVAWSYAQTDNKSPRLFKFLEEKLMTMKLSDWHLHRLARILWAFTKSGCLSSKLLYKISSAMLTHDFTELSQNGIEEVVFALQYCKHNIPPKLVSTVEKELMERAKQTSVP